MKHSVLDLTIFLSLFGTTFAFLKNSPFHLGSRFTTKTALSMAATSSSLGGISYRVSNVQQSVNFYTTVFGMKLVESNAEATSAKLIMDGEDGGQSAMTLNLFGGFLGDSSEVGDVSISSLELHCLNLQYSSRNVD